MDKFNGKEYLKIDIANCFGFDKLTWKERLIKAELIINSANKKDLAELANKADEPAHAYSALEAWFRTSEGKATGHLIGLDATASGPQILGIITEDVNACKLTNTINSGKRVDMYKNIYEKVQTRMGNKLSITRDQVKAAIMQRCYGGTATAKKYFEDYVDIFEDVMAEEMPNVWAFNQLALDMWDDTVLEYNWIMPDNFHINMKVMDKVYTDFNYKGQDYTFIHNENQPRKKGLALGANITHSIDGFINREMFSRCMFNPEIKKLLNLNANSGKNSNSYYNHPKTQKLLDLIDLYHESGYLSARVLDYVDENTIGFLLNSDLNRVIDLIKSLPEKPFDLLSIHDCFRCHANYGNDVREQYKNCLVELAKSDMLQFLLRQITGSNDITYVKDEPELYKKIEDEEYAIC